MPRLDFPAAALALVFGALSLPAEATAPPEEKVPDLVISAGPEGYAYWGLASRFKKAAEEGKISVRVAESSGSLENLERLNDPNSLVNLALAQSDALDQYLDSHPELKNRIDIVESIGLECVFLITRAGSPIETDADLAKLPNARIAIPGAESGAAATYHALAQLLPGFALAKPLFRDNAQQALDALSDKGPGHADVSLLVQRPKQRTREIQAALDNSQTYRFVRIAEKRQENTLPEGQSTYTFMDLPLVRQGNTVEKSVPTVCTKGLLIASASKIPPRVKRDMERMVAEKWMQIYSDEF